jgi:hypothetical protein
MFTGRETDILAGRSFQEGVHAMKRYLIATLILAAASTPALAAAGQHYVVEDTEKFCSVIDAAPSKNLKVLGDKQGYGSRDQAEQALKGLSCKALPG